MNTVRCSICDIVIGYSTEYIQDICCQTCEDIYKERKESEYKDAVHRKVAESQIPDEF